MNLSDKEIEFLYARLSDLFERAEKGVVSVSPFYSPAELVSVRRWISRVGAGERAVIYGGYEGCERARVYFLPDYITPEPERSISDVISDFGYAEPTVMLKITGSGFRELSHRDFMGSLLSLGIERDVIGDIVCESSRAACVFCDSAIAPYIKENLTKVANDTVKISESPLPRGSFGEREYEALHETVASCRLDSVVAAVCNLSRETAKKAVQGGLCSLNHETVCTPDALLCAGDVFSVRGKGKYTLASCDGENRRGRLRITVHKYK